MPIVPGSKKFYIGNAGSGKMMGNREISPLIGGDNAHRPGVSLGETSSLVFSAHSASPQGELFLPALSAIPVVPVLSVSTRVEGTIRIKLVFGAVSGLFHRCAVSRLFTASGFAKRTAMKRKVDPSNKSTS